MGFRRFIRAARLALLLVAVSPAGHGHAEGFLAGLEDLPLMQGLAQVAGAGMAFDTAQGRIVEVYARGNATAAQVTAFYDATLPQLGWAKVAEGGWRRENEVLRLDLVGGRPLVVRFAVSPE